MASHIVPVPRGFAVTNPLLVEASSQAEEDAAWAAGAVLVVRLDLMGGTTTTTAAPTTTTSTSTSTSTSTTTSTVAPNGLVPANANFDTDIVATTEQVGAWWKVVSGSGTAGRLASNEMTGSYVGFVTSAAQNHWALLAYRFSKADIDGCSGVMTFDIRPKVDGAIGITINAHDSNGNELIDGVAQETIIRILGNWAPGADTTTITGAQVNVTQTVSFNLKTWIEGRLMAGKTWADVDEVWFYPYVDLGGSLYFDNFR